MKKYILILLIIFLTGCSAKYEVEIKDKQVNEKSSFIISKHEVASDGIYYTVSRMAGKYFLNVDFLIGDTKEYYEGENAIYQKKSNTNINEYNTSDIFNYCYDAHNVLNEKKYYTISTSDTFKCFDKYQELEDVKIVLKTNHKVKDNNADSIDGYTYTWNINKKNYNNKRIYIKLYKDKYIFNYENEFYKKIALYGSAACAIIIIGLFVTLKVMRKRHKSNKI